MSELPDNVVKQFTANVYNMACQQVSRLRPLVMVESMNAESRFFERRHSKSVLQRASKFEDTPYNPTEFSRRCLRAAEYHDGDSIDWAENLNLLIDPTSSVVSAAAEAFARCIDDVIITKGFYGPAYEGKEGLDSVAFPSTQIVAATVGGSSGNVGLNLDKLIEAKSLFGKADIDTSMPGNELYMAVTQNQLDDLLKTEKLTSSDYANVKALVDGVVNKFMGFTFIRTERLLNNASGLRNCVAWCKSGVVLGVKKELSMRIYEAQGKCFNWAYYGAMSIGATRIEDKKVVHIPCAE